jgi:MFS transporter, ACS family, D-galactonate transporter
VQRPAPIAAITFLLALSVGINYIDRTNLSIAAPLLKTELHLSASQLGLIFSVFFWTYACFQLVSGWLADRIDVKWLLGGGLGLWSAATAAAALVHGFLPLLLARLILGVGESVAYPSYSRILVEHVPEDRRGRANGAIAAGQMCGIALGTIVGGMLVARLGWRPFFVGLGVLGFLWLVPWLTIMPSRPPGHAPDASPDTPTVAQIASQRTFWGACIGLFGANYYSYTFISWLPLYLVEYRHYSMDRMGVTTGAIYLLVAVTAMITGRTADRRIVSGLSGLGIRRTICAGGLAAAGLLLLLGMTFIESPISMVLLFGAYVGWGAFSAVHWAATQTLAGPLAAGRWTGMQNFAGNLAGPTAPLIAGILLDRTGGYFWGFVVTAVITTIGAAAWTFVIRDVRETNWRAQPPIVNPQSSIVN